jgi:hypothetical protein
MSTEKQINIDREPPLVLNMDDQKIKFGLMQDVGQMHGLWEFKMKPRKRTRTLDQNSFYWVAVCAPLARWLTAQSGETFTANDAHEFLKNKFCPAKVKEIVNQHGEVIEVAQKKSTTKLDTKEMSDYVQACSDWMWDFCGIMVVSSKLFYENAA